MLPSARKSFALVLSAGLLLGLLTACSKQGEGERCDLDKASHSDCEDGLLCTNVGTEAVKIERCCPPDLTTASDSRCNRTITPPVGTAGSSSGGGSGENGAGTGGTDTGGTDTGGTDTGAGAGGEPSSGAGGDTQGGVSGAGAASGAGGS